MMDVFTIKVKTYATKAKSDIFYHQYLVRAPDRNLGV